MEVAIIGAGISGLACAITLERYGIEPAIFEKRSCVGDRFINAEAMFHILNRPVKDSLPYVSAKFGISLEPIDEVTELVIHSKNKVGHINGKIGYTNLRGRHNNSYEVQLEKQVKSPIYYNSNESFAQLYSNYDKVIIAAGEGEYSCYMGNYRSDLACTIKGATVKGSFDSKTPHVWFNYEIIPKGYAWVIPFNDEEAHIVIAYPEYPENIKLDLQNMWNSFYDLASRDLKQNFIITDEFEIKKYLMGICNKPKIDNAYFIGNCFGTISPGLGFGQFAAILTGVYAAYDICGKGKYEKLVKHMYGNYSNSLTLRKYLENLNDKDLDFAISCLDKALLSKLTDRLCGTKCAIDVLKYITPIFNISNYFKSKRHDNDTNS